MALTLAEKIKAVLKEKGLTQAGLADLMGVSHQRVRNLAAGRVSKLEEAEAKAIVQKAHIRGDWLLTGEGPISQVEGELRLTMTLNALKETTEKALSLGLSARRAELVRDVLFAVAMSNTELLNSTIDRIVQSGGMSDEDYPSDHVEE